MIKVTRECFCDLCGASNAKTYNTLAEFTTEQNEGRIVTPYVTMADIELCGECLDKVVVLRASGAQGNNKFRIKDNRKYTLAKKEKGDDVQDHICYGEQPF